MSGVTRKTLAAFAGVLALALIGAVFMQPTWCTGSSADADKQVEEEKKADENEPAEADDEKPGDFWIDLREKHGEDLDAAIDEAIREMHERMAEIEKQMDELRRESPRLRDPDRDRDWLWWRDRLRDRRDLQPPSEVEELLRELQRELPREWPLHMQELLRELERDPSRDQQLFRFRLEPKPDRFSFSLRMDMQETDEAYIFTLDVPGMDKEEIVVEVTDNVLSISGERKERVEEEQEGEHVRREITYGRFERTVTLPRDADTDTITSKYDDGVLTITVPRKQQEAEKSRRVIVNHP